MFIGSIFGISATGNIMGGLVGGAGGNLVGQAISSKTSVNIDKKFDDDDKKKWKYFIQIIYN